VASRIKAGDRRVSQHSLPDRVAYSLRGDCQIPGGKAAKELFLEDRSSKFIGLDPVEIYKQILQHEVPFIPDELLIGDSSLLFKICIELAANISINNGTGALGEDEVQKLTILAHEQLWTEQEAAGLLLLLPRLCLESAIVEKVCRQSRPLHSLTKSRFSIFSAGVRIPMGLLLPLLPGSQHLMHGSLYAGGHADSSTSHLRYSLTTVQRWTPKLSLPTFSSLPTWLPGSCDSHKAPQAT
jgi:hypothetical protein